MTANATAQFWTEAGRRWADDDRRVEAIGGDFGRLAMARLDLRPGQRVLDIGCGTGVTTVELGERTSPHGTAVGVDLSPTMVAAAQRQASSAAVSFVQADFEQWAVAPGSFDRAFSRFGVMFFARPEEAFAKLRRTLRTDGRLAFAAWQGSERNDWMRLPAAAAAEVLGTPIALPESGAPGPFAFEDARRITGVLSAAGFRSIDIVPHDDEVLLPVADGLSFAAGSISHGGIRNALRGASPAIQQVVQQAIADRLAARATNGIIRISRGAHIVVAAP